jgi:hypothetical protein
MTSVLVAWEGKTIARRSAMSGSPRRGFEVGPNEVLYTARGKDGLWSAWVEDRQPVSACDQTIKVFDGGSAFQAQIKAIRWRKCLDETAGEPLEQS